jgi:tRNA-5-methyluridine54 2-sulfurtransferase
MTSIVCRRCSQRAAIRMRQHRLSFCKDHYLEWFIEQTERAIKKYKMFTQQERVLIAVSGGKDSLALWDVLAKLGYQADGLYLNLGIDSEDGYSDESERFSREFAQQRGLHLNVVNIAEMYGESVPQMAKKSRRGRYKPCSSCGLVKRHEMNRVATDLGYPVLATAHNLDDEVAILFGNVLMWQTDLLARQSPVLPSADGFARKVKPFCRFYERETAAYALLAGIEYIEEECPHAEGSKQLYYKEMINKMEEEQPGIKLAFYVGFLKTRQKGVFQNGEGEAAEEVLLRPCPSCGLPTTSLGICAFCRTVGAEG